MKNKVDIEGLTEEEVIENRKTFGENIIESYDEKIFFRVIKEICSEPMFILLLIACSLYFSLNKIREGFIMLFSIFIVSGISFFQEYRSRNSINALKNILSSKSKVIRDKEIKKVTSAEIVMHDIFLLEEGEIVPADGFVIESNDFFVNESILTGESFAVHKPATIKSMVFRGTLITNGNAIIQTTAIGKNTEIGRIGLSLKNINIEKTPLQIQIKSLVNYMVYFGSFAFLLVVVINYIDTKNFIQSFIKGLTLAMSILPEEIPVAFSSFQALAAFRLLKKNNIIVKQPQYVETLGTTTVICADKTGTITENKMQIALLYDSINNIEYAIDKNLKKPNELIEYAMWSSETNPYDPMEKSIHEMYENNSKNDNRESFQKVHEYTLSGTPPFMTHVFKQNSRTIIAAKGAPEGLLICTKLSEKEKNVIIEQTKKYARNGYRVLGVGKSSWPTNEWPINQTEFDFIFLGLIAFYDPPKKNIQSLIQSFYKAGINFKIITGDYPETAISIAKQIGLENENIVLTGKEVNELTNNELAEKIKSVNIFARMFPDAKLKIIEALKRNGDIVAMTGDGVNDAPALKAAHIGISMGSSGSEVAKNASSIIITDDNLGHMIDAVAIGRKIYDNLKKAIQYIISIHIPIILIVLLPLFVHFLFKDIFTPVHVIFLELIMGPTCSIIYENEEMEAGTMLRPPRKLSATFLSFNQLKISIIQGLLITTGCMLTGMYFINQEKSFNYIRASVFITLLFSNIFLTLTNRSLKNSFFETLKYKNNLLPIIILTTLIFILIIQYFPMATNLFYLEKLPLFDLLFCLIISFVTTWWIEGYKYIKRKYTIKEA